MEKSRAEFKKENRELKIALGITLFGLLLGAVILMLQVRCFSHEWFDLEIRAEPQTAAIGDTINLLFRAYGDEKSLNEFERVSVQGAAWFKVVLNLNGENIVTESRIPVVEFNINRENFSSAGWSGGGLFYLKYEFPVIISIPEERAWLLENAEVVLLEFSAQASAVKGDAIQLYGSTEFVSVAVDLR